MCQEGGYIFSSEGVILCHEGVRVFVMRVCILMLFRYASF